MMVHIREVIKAGEMPEGFPLENWKQEQKALRDPDQWDNACYDAVVQQEKKVVTVLCLLYYV